MFFIIYLCINNKILNYFGVYKEQRNLMTNPIYLEVIMFLLVELFRLNIKMLMIQCKLKIKIKLYFD